ncbi:nucleotidyl transferase AbiEii/AbiGii toxin family protein [Enhygromyxa salina]|uniref:Nucleotidyltransferase family protein n=1 Tax=Enhygromyxa salina TaxID=215803 RepID=A0A2S9YBX1_9BACT|nr:nucleotidyl transferase AbiEii/AbiGii toxin family protein [Enhygromyxa salina]PRQ02600.1 hypothetical protein ENSA7_55720 [Enhygromyxa salina]
MDLYAELCALVRGLDQAQVEYALCGGLAMAVYGIPRATRDIDLLARRADLEKFREVAHSRGFTDELMLMPFGGGLSAQRFRIPDIHDPDPLTLDVLLFEGELDLVWNSRTQVQFEAGSICVVSKPGLMTLKRRAGRPQDMVDIQLLEMLDDD